MTSAERRANWIVAAAVISLVVHVACMIYARPKVMTRVAAGVSHAARAMPVRMVKESVQPAPVKIDALADVQPVRDMPDVETERPPEVRETEMPAAEAKSVVSPDAALPSEALKTPVPEARPVFDATPIKMDDRVSAKIPMKRIETPSVQPLTTGVPSALPSGAVVPRVAKTVPTTGLDPNSVFLPSALPPAPPAPVVKPVAPQVVSEQISLPEEVLPKVDEKVVEAEKTAVKQLVDAPTAKVLDTVLAAKLTRADEGGWTYFRVVFDDRRLLRPVSKDFVLLIDASGSIGGERMRSIRKAAKRILRSATNSGDRFNLVAFRDRYSYAFRSWQECNQHSFDQAEKWLNNLAAHGRTDVFDTIASVLTLPRNPQRPLIALVVTDGEANVGISDTSEILARFTALNDGLVSVYMYGVKSSANRELIDVLTHGNRGDSFITDGWWWEAGDSLDLFSERFRDPVLSDLRIVFAAGTPATAYPRLLRNFYRGQPLDFVARVPSGTRDVAFSLKGLHGAEAYEGYYRLSLIGAAAETALPALWRSEQKLDLQFRKD